MIGKTMKSNRVVVVPKNVIDILKDYRNRNDSKWLFPSPRDKNEPIYPQTVYITLQRILKKIDCQHIRFHDLRHTFATMSLANGMNVKTLAEILGHTSVKTTLDIYSHVTDEMKRKSAQKIEAKMGRNETLPAHLKQFTEIPEEEKKSPSKEKFTPYKSKIRRSGSGGLYQINDHLWEGRYTPTLANGKRHGYNVYAKTREECEELLDEMIIRVKAEIAEAKKQLQMQNM